jgi:hypothetical protein
VFVCDGRNGTLPNFCDRLYRCRQNYDAECRKPLLLIPSYIVHCFLRRRGSDVSLKHNSSISVNFVEKFLSLICSSFGLKHLTLLTRYILKITNISILYLGIPCDIVVYIYVQQLTAIAEAANTKVRHPIHDFEAVHPSPIFLIYLPKIHLNIILTSSFPSSKSIRGLLSCDGV